LPLVGGITQNLLVTCHRCVETHFTDYSSRMPKHLTMEYSTVL